MRLSTIPLPPSDAEGLRLYQALGSPVPTATADFARAYLPHLAGWLQATNRRVSADLCDEAAVETLYNFLAASTRFDADRSKSLLGFLRLSARRDLLNLLRREARHKHDGLEENAVELAPSSGKYSGKVPGPLQLLCDQEDEEERRLFLEKLRATLNESEQRVLELMLDGVRGTQRYVEAMAVADLPLPEQRQQVKRVKDRINKRAQRMREEP